MLAPLERPDREDSLATLAKLEQRDCWEPPERLAFPVPWAQLVLLDRKGKPGRLELRGLEGRRDSRDLLEV